VPFGGGSCEICLAGRLSESVLAALECEAWGLTVSVEPAEMVLDGSVQDQAALGSLVDRFLSHGLEAVEVRRRRLWSCWRLSGRSGWAAGRERSRLARPGRDRPARAAG
jgi:hypothetical protein